MIFRRRRRAAKTPKLLAFRASAFALGLLYVAFASDTLQDMQTIAGIAVEANSTLQSNLQQTTTKEQEQK
jgi:hypothetical protein